MASQANSPTGPVAAAQVASAVAGWPGRAHGTLAQKLAQALRAAIAAGVLRHGIRLPAERALADALAVSRSTITRALDELRAEGVLESRQGSGTRVRGPEVPAMAPNRIAQHLLEWSGIDLAAGNPPDPSHLPPVKVDVAALVSGGGGPGVQPLGLPALRAALAERHTADGRLTDPEQIHVTAGAHQAVALLIRSLAGPGDGVAVEDPSYPGIFDIVDSLGARACPVASDGAGLLPEALDRVLAEGRTRVLYLQGGPHNPTGRVPAPGRLRALAGVLDGHDVTVVEDCALAELTFAGRVRSELADLCRRAVVASVGSFSKVAWGGLRVGWLRGPAPLVERTMYQRLAADLGTSVPAQLLALQLLPELDEIAHRRRSALEGIIDQALDQLGDELPQWSLIPPRGGSVLWAELPVADSGPFVHLAGRHGVHVAPGSVARAEGAADPHVRICVDRPAQTVEVGLRRLALAWRELQAAPGPVLG